MHPLHPLQWPSAARPPPAAAAVSLGRARGLATAFRPRITRSSLAYLGKGKEEGGGGRISCCPSILPRSSSADRRCPLQHGTAPVPYRHVHKEECMSKCKSRRGAHLRLKTRYEPSSCPTGLRRSISASRCRSCSSRRNSSARVMLSSSRAWGEQREGNGPLLSRY